MPPALRRVDTGVEALTDLEMIIGYDDDLRAEATRIAGRGRGLLVATVYPVLERTVGHRLGDIGVFLTYWPPTVAPGPCYSPGMGLGKHHEAPFPTSRGDSPSCHQTGVERTNRH